MSEDDLVRNGTSMWLWDSAANTVTHVTAAGQRAGARAVPAMPLTPQQAARQALAETGPATIVRVDPTVTVAGQAAYQLVLAPRSSRSLIGQVRIAIDSRRRVPLRVQVFARGAATPGRPGRVHRRLVQPAAGRRLRVHPARRGHGHPAAHRAASRGTAGRPAAG